MFLIAEQDNQCVGFGSIVKDKSEIETLFVQPEFFGQGIGSKLLVYLEQTIEQPDDTQILVDSTINAISFYKRHGYQFHSEVVHTEPDGTEIQCVRMCKRLK